MSLGSTIALPLPFAWMHRDARRRRRVIDCSWMGTDPQGFLQSTLNLLGLRVKGLGLTGVNPNPTLNPR